MYVYIYIQTYTQTLASVRSEISWQNEKTSGNVQFYGCPIVSSVQGQVGRGTEN